MGNLNIPLINTMNIIHDDSSLLHKLKFLSSVKTDMMEGVQDDNLEFQSCSLPNAIEIQSMFNDWKKSPQQRLADLVEALTLSTVDENKSRTAKQVQCHPVSVDEAEEDGIDQSLPCEEETCNCNSSAVTIGSIVRSLLFACFMR